jgi:hypothetical protein
MVWHAPSRPRADCFRDARMDEAVPSWFGQHFVRSVLASHLRVDFTSLHETQKGCTGKPLLGGFCFAGLVGSCRTADNEATKYEHKSEKLHSIAVSGTFGRAEILTTQDDLEVAIKRLTQKDPLL